jgi:hypothetical protein
MKTWATKQMPRWVTVVLGVVVVLAILALLSPGLPVYRQWGFICENTGSHKGYTSWLGGIHTGRWHRESKLESFIVAKHPERLEHRWTSYAGTGYNIFGRRVLCGHGRPGAIMQINPEALNRYVGSLTDEATLELYELLLSDDQDRIAADIQRMWDRAIELKWGTQQKH